MTRKLGGGALGRENAGGGREWYVKDYQGSLVMTVVNDAVGNVIAYEPYVRRNSSRRVATCPANSTSARNTSAGSAFTTSARASSTRHSPCGLPPTPPGLLGMEGRGVYAGGTVAGLHGEWSHRDGASWGFEERVYYGSTDEGNKLAEDKKHREVSRMLWLPSLGSLGRLKFGGSYDETNKHMQQYQKEYLLKLAEDKGDSKFLRFLLKAYGDGTELSPKYFNQVLEGLSSLGLVETLRPSLGWLPFGNKYEKYTFRRSGAWWEYGNVEFKLYPGCKAVSSFNSSNNWIDHFFIDGIGYIMSN